MNSTEIEAAFDMGVADAAAAIANQTSIDDLFHYHALKVSGKQEIKGHTYGSFLSAKANGELKHYNIFNDPYMNKYTYKALNKKK